MLKESVIESPVPKNKSAKVNPIAEAIKPIIIPMIISLLFKFPGV